MILGECAVFAAMFIAGAAAGVIAVFLGVLGRAGRATRAITDVLMSAEIGAAYFFTLYYSACGVFRLYSLAAFLLGVYLAYKTCRRFSKPFRRMMRKVVSPIVFAYDRAAAKWGERLRPIREKTEARHASRLALRMEKRERRRALREEKKSKKCKQGAEPSRKKNARIVVER